MAKGNKGAGRPGKGRPTDRQGEKQTKSGKGRDINPPGPGKQPPPGRKKP